MEHYLHHRANTLLQSHRGPGDYSSTYSRHIYMGEEAKICPYLLLLFILLENLVC
jgi:hypothetical protein